MIKLFMIPFVSLCLYAPIQAGYFVSKIKIKSSLIGKDRFAQQYQPEVGEKFDQSQHKRSIELITDELVHEGYLHASITDTLSYDQPRNNVLVTLNLVPGTRYTISAVSVAVKGVKEGKELTQELESELEGVFKGEYARKELIDGQSKRIRTLLVKKGYLAPEIILKKQSYDDLHQLSLCYEISLTKRHEFRFKGNHFFKSSDFLDDVLILEEQGVSLPPALIAEDIEELYTKKGFMQANVTWRTERDGVTFLVTEGPRFTVQGVSIKECFTHSEALTRIHKLEQSLKSMGAFDEEVLETLLNECSLDLSTLGFWNIQLDKSVSQAKKGSHVDIAITLSQSGSEKGVIKRTEISDVQIPRYEFLLEQQPFIHWKSRSEPHPISPSEIEQQKNWLLRYLIHKGYLNATVTHIFEEKKQGTVLVWHIDDHAGPVVMGSVTWKGLCGIKPFIVQRELCFQPGDVWNSQKLDQSIQRLTELCMFESISVRPLPIVPITGSTSEKILSRPLVITCIEDDPYELRSRLGLQFVSKSFTNISWTTWKVGGSFIWKNPSGYADRVILDADWTRYTLNLAASYEIPWLGSLPVRTLFKIYSDRFDQPLISTNHYRLYTESHEGGSVQFYHAHPWWTSCVRLGVEANKVAGVARRLASVIHFEPTLVDRRIPYLYAEPSVVFEQFDNKHDPTKGFFTSGTLKAMVPPGVSDGWFVKVLLEQSFFYPLYESVIGALRWRFGHIFNAKFSTILPTERFYLGGANSLRGYETNMAPPLNDVECDGKTIWVPVGGKTMANVNAEIRFPVYRMISGVVFTDMGILTQDRFADIAAHKWLGATGFGVRLASPIGPIRFDIGWKWHKRDPRDKSYAFFFTFGHAF